MASLMKLETMVNGMNLKEMPLHHVCEACIQGKHQRIFFPKDEATRASKLLELVHNDKGKKRLLRAFAINNRQNKRLLRICKGLNYN